MNLNEAMQIGTQKLKLRPEILMKAKEAAKEMGVLPAHMPPMMLALAIMGVAKAVDPEELSGELTDALALVSRAEKEFEMEKRGMRH